MHVTDARLWINPAHARTLSRASRPRAIIAEARLVEQTHAASGFAPRWALHANGRRSCKTCARFIPPLSRAPSMTILDHEHVDLQTPSGPMRTHIFRPAAGGKYP